MVAFELGPSRLFYDLPPGSSLMGARRMLGLLGIEPSRYSKFRVLLRELLLDDGKLGAISYYPIRPPTARYPAQALSTLVTHK